MFSFSFLILLIWALFFFFSWWVWLKVYQFCLSFKRTSFTDLFYCFFFISLSFISALIFMIYFLPQTLGFVCSFSSCFKCKFRWFTWDFTYFLRWECISINFRLRTAFAASQTLTWPNFCIYYFPSKSTAAKARLVSVVGHSLSIQIFHRYRVYQTYCRALVWGLCSYLEKISFLFLSCTAPEAQLWFWPQLCM